MENLDKENQPTEVFDVRGQRVEFLDETIIKELQKKCIVNLASWSYDTIPPIMRNNWLYQWSYASTNISISDTAFSKFPYFIKLIEKWVDWSWNMAYLTDKKAISYKNLHLFLLKSGFIKDWKYFFYTWDWQILTVNKTDFDVNWLFAQSFGFFWNQWDSDFLWNTQKKIFDNGYESVADGSWFIHFFQDWKVLDIPWDSIFKIDFKNVLVSERWNLHQYNIWNGTYKRLETYSVPFKWISQMVVDYNKNFLLIVNETDEWFTLHIALYDDFINNKQINEVYAIKNVKEICGLWREGWMVCLMTDWSLKYYWNTFHKFKKDFFKDKENWTPAWKLIYPKDQEVVTIEDNRKTELLKSLQDWTISIDLTGDEEDKTDKIDAEIIDKIWDIKIPTWWVEVTFKEFFDNSNDEKSIEQVLKAFKIIQRNPQISKFEWITKVIEKKILSKKTKIILEFIFSELWDITLELWEASDLSTLVSIKERLYKIKRKRRNIQAWAIKEDEDLKDLIEVVEKKISDYKESHKDDFEKDIQANLEKLQKILDKYENSIDISSIYENPVYQETEEMISCLDSLWQEKYKKSLKWVIDARRKEIKTLLEKEKEDEAKAIEREKVEVEWLISEVKDILDDIDDIDTIEQYKENDPLVQKIRKSFENLPSSIAQALNLKLDRIFSERIFALRLSWEETKWVVQNLDSYGIDTILYYDEDWLEQVEWKIEWKEKSDWRISLVVKLMNWETHEYDKWIYLKDADKFGAVLIWDDIPKFDMSLNEFAKFNKLLWRWKRIGKNELKTLSKKIQTEKNPIEKEKLRKEFNDKKIYYKDARYTELLISRLIKQQKLNPRSKVPEYDPNYIVLDEEKEILKKLSARLVDQKENGGIEILEWWPWLWKTVMCEFLAQATNREIIRVQCSKMDPNDMFFSPTLKNRESSHEPADWIKLMQKPWTIILFDEIDKLNDQCFERLHSLFDRSRSVYHPQLWKFKANPDCLFLWTRNLYDRMTNPILSRWRLLRVTYPWVLNEAFKISKYTNNSILKKMTNDEFKNLYDKFITRWEPAPTNVREKKIYDLIININHLLNVFTELRKYYDSDEPFVYEVSYRDARQVFADMFIEFEKSWDFKKAMEDILIPKAEGAVLDPDDKKIQKEMVQRAIDWEMW